ncbi:MAG: undecaprenyl-phosphate glucose phosphotransferase [Alphaproteobacteria bacterium]|nr:undecaprenyl-phosphate glucose phosphotransferase [Alphaproteobacteria bacterium]
MSVATTLSRQDGTRQSQWRVPISWGIVSGIWMLLDSIVILGCGTTSYLFYVGWSHDNLGIYTGAICFVWISILVLSQFSGLTEADAVLSPLRVLDRILIVGATCFLFLLAIAFSLKVSDSFSRVWVYTFAITTSVTVIGFRFGGALVLRQLARSGWLARRVAVFGSGEQAELFLSQFEDGSNGLSRLVGVFDDRPESVGSKLSGEPISGEFEDLVSAIRRGEVDDVVVALPWCAEEHLTDVVSHLQELPVNIYLGFDLVAYKYRFRGSPSHFAGLNLVEIVDTPLSGWRVVIKAIEDRVLAAALLILTMPVFLIVALAIRVDSPGPVFFRQTRYGFNNKKFSIYKFRSMEHRNETDGRTVQATQNDPRVTRVGRILRKTSLDELPQFLNVLNGTMSLVGPRPHAVDHNEDYAKVIRGYFARHNMKPGITGLAQVNGLRGETDTIEKMKERVRYDVFYTDNWSLWLDLRILFKTAYAVWFCKNAY